MITQCQHEKTRSPKFTPSRSMSDEWAWRCESMVEQLLMDTAEEALGDTPEASLLEQMTAMCLKRLDHQRGGSMRKSDLGGFLKGKLGRLYQRGWLRHVIAAMEDRQLVCSTAWDVSRVAPPKTKPGLRWCHFNEECKYMRNIEGNASHFQQFVHLCPQGVRCKYVTEHLLGQKLSKEATEHFRRWKHRCPQGHVCVHHANADMYPDHLLVFTHRASLYKEHQQ